MVPSAGSWQLYARGHGFRQQAFDRHENFFSAVVLTPGEPTYDLTFRLEPDSAIAGNVLDEAGEPVRNAHVTLVEAGTSNPDLGEDTGRVRSSTATDDRGHYEFADLAPGEYKVEVQAEPWYAAGAQARRFANTGAAPTNPSLDVVYPQTWFPGVTDRQSGEVLSLHHGDIRQANFNLTPAPATHLHIGSPTAGGQGSPRGQIFPQIERISSDAIPFVNSSMRIDQQGQIDIGGLSPGLYRVTLQGDGGQQAPVFLRVPGGAQHTLDMSSTIPVADLNIHFEDDAGAGSVQVILTDVDSGTSFVSYGQGGFQRRRNADIVAPQGGDRKLEVLPARYRVTLRGDGDIYLAGLAIKNKPVAGRIVTLPNGSTTLTLKLARGRAAVRGIALAGGKPIAAAMVMLVPATFGQPESIPVLRRDQTNTDGGFLIENILPGDYILLAIDRGWAVNWRDPATLARYLIHGVPVALQANATLKQDLAAQTP